MRSRWNLPIYLIFAAICVVVIGVIVGQMGLTYPWAHPYRLTAVFRTGDGILVNNEVFMNGTKVGKVSDVQPVSNQARVEMIIDNESALPVYRDATAIVRKKNLLGETYLEISRGAADSGKMETGDEIPLEHTLQTTQIEQVLAILDPQTRNRLQLLINGAGDALTNRGADMNAEAHSLDTLGQALNGPAAELQTRQDQLSAIVLELQKLYDVLANQREQVRDGFATWNQVMGQLAAQDQGIVGTVRQADTLLTNLDQLAGGEVSNIRATLEAAGPSLTTFDAFLNQTNDILGSLAPYRRSIHDVFPDLGTSFQDTVPSGQHLWSVFSVGDCNNGMSGCTKAASSTGGSIGSTASADGAPNALWASVMGGSG
jgi:phospholipid/cholesterol/gamma-HCH transport system substrate-binding protein